METVPREVRTELSPGGMPGATSRLHFSPAYAPVPAYAPFEPGPFLHLDAPVRVRLGLQQRAATNLRRHVLRAVRRFAVLVVADLTSFYLIRELVRALRDSGVLGGAVATRIHEVLPSGILGGWQYAAALFVALFLTGNYGFADQRRDARRLFIACALATALPLWMTLWTRGLEPVLVQFAVTTLLVWAGLLAERRVIDRVVARVLPSPEQAATLFVGWADDCREAMASEAFGRESDSRVVGFVDVNIPPAADALGQIADFPELLHGAGAEAVVMCGYLPDPRFGEVVDAALAAGAQVLSVPRAIEIAGVQPLLVWRQSKPLIELTRPTLKGSQLLLKRMVDLMGATAALVLLSPIFAVVALAVKLESCGSTIFGHRRVGLNGHSFKCFKFRSMHPDAEKRLRSDHALYAEYVSNDFKLPEDRDPRLTRVGRFLRRTSLDELPQLINVLKGEMSLVGPRPIVQEEIDVYGHGAPVFLSLKPGMTGAWQTNGRSDVGYPLRADIELEYVRNWSLGRDLRILFKTFPAVLTRRGAH